MKIQDLFSHPAKGWHTLPKPPVEADPADEQLIGGLRKPIRRFWDKMTSTNRHATPAYYWGIGFALAVITLLEVWLFGVPISRFWFVVSMLVLALLKFVLVIFFFMHLKFDNKMYSQVFIFCMVLGVSVYVSAIYLLAFHGAGQ